MRMFCVCFGLDELDKDSTDETCPLIGEHNKSEETSNETESLEDGLTRSLECSSTSLSSLEADTVHSEDIGSRHSSDEDSVDSFLLIDLEDNEVLP